jgi:hypothetical protein
MQASDLVWMRSAQTEHMHDVCQRLVHSFTVDSHNQQIAVFTLNTTLIPFGLETKPGSEAPKNHVVEVRWDAVGRFPVALALEVQDQIKVISRYGETLASPIIYQVLGPKQQGPTAFRVRLIRVEPHGETT